MTDRNLDDLHFGIESLCKQWQAECEANGLKVLITETWRDPMREDTLHAQGITAAMGRTCKHCFTINSQPASKAFDFAVLDEDNRMVQDGTDHRYTFAGAIGTKLGLIWGGNFTTTKDYDHFEIA